MMRVLAGWECDGPREHLGVVGVLATKIVRLRSLPGLPLLATLKGHRLVGNELVGTRTLQEPCGVKSSVSALAKVVESGESDCILFEDVDVEASLHHAIREYAKAGGVLLHYPSEPQPHWWIDFPTPADDYWKKFSKKSRYNIRSAAKKLDHNLRRFTGVDDVPRFLQLAHQVSMASWQAKRLGLRIKNSPHEREWYQRLAGIGAFRSYILESQARPIAFAVGLQWNGQFSYEEVGYDLSFAGQSPGTVLLLKIVEDLIAHDTPRRFDFGFGDGEYKQLFGNRRTTTGPVLLVRRTRRNAAVIGIDRCARELSRYTRDAVRRSSLLTVLRQTYRR